jgi:hypothetical protein
MICKNIVEKYRRKRTLGCPLRILKNTYIEMERIEIAMKAENGAKWFSIVSWRAFVNTILNLGVSCKQEFLDQQRNYEYKLFREEYPP